MNSHWFKEGFPGSAAEKLRSKIARSIVLYSVVVGGAIFFFAPYSRRYRQRLRDNGGKPDDFEFFKQQKLAFQYNDGVLAKPSLEEFLELRREKERHVRQDVGGQDLTEEKIRKLIEMDTKKSF